VPWPQRLIDSKLTVYAGPTYYEPWNFTDLCDDDTLDDDRYLVYSKRVSSSILTPCIKSLCNKLMCLIKRSTLSGLRYSLSEPNFDIGMISLLPKGHLPCLFVSLVPFTNSSSFEPDGIEVLEEPVVDVLVLVVRSTKGALADTAWEADAFDIGADILRGSGVDVRERVAHLTADVVLLRFPHQAEQACACGIVFVGASAYFSASAAVATFQCIQLAIFSSALDERHDVCPVAIRQEASA
jgi:hypothetical protein